MRGRSMLLAILAIFAIGCGLAAFIGLSYAGSAFIGPWAGIVLPLGVVAVAICVVLVVTATKESGW